MTDERSIDLAVILRDGAAIDASLRAAFAETVRRHRFYQVPLVVWRDGRVQEVSADELGATMK